MAVGRVGNCLIVVGGNRYDSEQKGYSIETIQDVTDMFDLAKPDLTWKR